jgi:Bacterial PH domain
VSGAKPDLWRGLPQNLPPGETVLWQGRPCWRALARRVMHVRPLAIYFTALVVWRAVTVMQRGAAVLDVIAAAAFIALLGAVAIALLSGYAWLAARTSIYTLTTKRLVLRCGVALPKWVNVPLCTMDAAGLRTFADGTGDILLTLSGEDRVAYLALWPHVRPWRFAPAQPMLRGLADPAEAARILGRALSALAEQAAVAVPSADAKPAWRPSVPAAA